MNEPLLQIRGVRRDYRMGEQVLHALDGVDTDIRSGEIIALMGPSGSGKSTLLNIIGCLDRPTAGSYRLEGQEVTELAERDRVALRRYKIGFIFQTFHLVPRLSALRNVELPMVFANLPADERRDRAVQCLEAVGLGRRVDHRPDQLSGGERQRVAIARAVAMSPPILLADEPTGNLDSASGAEVIRLLLDLHQRGHTILIVTHSAEVAAIGHRTLRMKDGRFV